MIQVSGKWKIARCLALLTGSLLATSLPLQAKLIYKADFENYSAGDEIVSNRTGNDNTFSGLSAGSTISGSFQAFDGSAVGMNGGLSLRAGASAFTSEGSVTAGQSKLGKYGVGKALIVSFDTYSPSADLRAAFHSTGNARMGANAISGTLLNDKSTRVTMVMNQTGTDITLPGALGALATGNSIVYYQISGESAFTELKRQPATGDAGGFGLTVNLRKSDDYRLFDNIGAWDSPADAVGGISVLQLPPGTMIPETGSAVADTPNGLPPGVRIAADQPVRTAAAATSALSGGLPPGTLIATDYPDLNAAVAAIPPPGGILYIPPGTYTLKRPLNLADTYGPYAGKERRRITLMGGGSGNTEITGNFPGEPLVDAVNCAALRVSGLTFKGNCKVIWLSGRRDGDGGGGNFFEDVAFRDGPDTEVVVCLVASECNRFDRCDIRTDAENGIAIAFTSTPEFTARGIDYKITSPYVGDALLLRPDSTTVLSIENSFIHSSGYNSIGLYVKGNAADVSVNDGYNFNIGFASFYLDGKMGNVSDTSFRNIRIEGGRGGLYCLYAEGAVFNVTIDGGCWASMGEIIRYVATDGFAKNQGASNWRINTKTATIANNSIRLAGTGKKATGAQLKIPEGSERAFIRADRLHNCRIDIPTLRAYRTVAATRNKAAADDPEWDQGAAPAEDIGKNKTEWFRPLQVVCSDWAEGNTIIAERMEDVVLPADPAKNRGNRIETLNDSGVRRTYLSGGVRPEVMNFSLSDVRTLQTPKVGDVVMDDGNSRPDRLPGLMFFNGKNWVSLGQ